MRNQFVSLGRKTGPFYYEASSFLKWLKSTKAELVLFGLVSFRGMSTAKQIINEVKVNYDTLAVSEKRTSMTCPRCDCFTASHLLTDRTFYCGSCGYARDRDEVGAFNIYRNYVELFALSSPMTPPSDDSLIPNWSPRVAIRKLNADKWRTESHLRKQREKEDRRRLAEEIAEQSRELTDEEEEEYTDRLFKSKGLNFRK